MGHSSSISGVEPNQYDVLVDSSTSTTINYRIIVWGYTGTVVRIALSGTGYTSYQIKFDLVTFTN